VDVEKQLLLRPQLAGIAQGQPPAERLDLLQKPRILGKAEDGLGIVEIAVFRSADERLPAQGVSRPQGDDRLVEDAEGGPADQVAEFRGKMVRLEIDVVLDELPRLDDGVVDLALQVVRLPEDRGVPDPHCERTAEGLRHFVVEPLVELHEGDGVVAREGGQIEGAPHLQDHQEVLLPERFPAEQ
jgi:hypothetical protein